MTQNHTFGYYLGMSSVINDPIQTLVHFKSGKLIPLKFLWKNRSYKIDSLTTVYSSRDGGVDHVHYGALSGGNLYELVYTPHDYSWVISQSETS